MRASSTLKETTCNMQAFQVLYWWLLIVCFLHARRTPYDSLAFYSLSIQTVISPFSIKRLSVIVSYVCYNNWLRYFVASSLICTGGGVKKCEIGLDFRPQSPLKRSGLKMGQHVGTLILALGDEIDKPNNWLWKCNFLVVINTNLHPISHRFEVIGY